MNSQGEREIDATNAPMIFPVCDSPLIKAIATARLAGSLAKILLIHPQITIYAAEI
jgi:hypothetical protein